MYFTLAKHEVPMVSEALNASTIDSANTIAWQNQADARLTELCKYPTGQIGAELVYTSSR